MASEAGARGRRRTRRAAAALLLGAAMPVQVALAQTSTEKSIYTCTDEHGRRLTSDRPIPECIAREQRVLNRDGSVRQVVPPAPTADERAAREQAERAAARKRAEQADAVRRDKNLLARFPDEAAHRKAREAALDTARRASKATETRLRELAAERVPLLNEAEFYRGRALPPQLKSQLDANDAAAEAQRAAAVTQSAEMVRINKLYDQELLHLKKLWAGAPPGSIDPTAPAAEAAAAPPPAPPKPPAAAGKS